MAYDEGALQKWIGDRLAEILSIDRDTAAEIAAADLVANMPVELLARHLGITAEIEE